MAAFGVSLGKIRAPGDRQSQWRAHNESQISCCAQNLRGEIFLSFSDPKTNPSFLAISTFQTPTGPNEMQSTEDCISFGSTSFSELPKQEKDSHAQQGFIGFTFSLTILPQTSHKNKIPTFYFLATFGLSGPRHHFIAKYINIV